jgi:hypothetical protein
VSQQKEIQQMSVNDEAPAPITKTWFSLGVKLLVAAVVIGFAVLHIFGDAALRSPLVSAKADSAGSNSYGD